MAKILSIASGKGGVGKSVISSNLALLLTKQGKRVVLTDFDTGGANQHVLFGLFHPTVTMTDFLSHRIKTLEEVAQPVNGYQNLRLIPGTGDTLRTANLQHARKKRLIRHLKELDADIIVVDVGAGTHYHTLDFFLLADHHLAVATPDPTSVLDLYRFIKLAAIRKVLTAFATRDPVANALLDQEFQSMSEVLEAVRETNEEGVPVAQQALHDFQPYLILNRMTSGSRINTLQLQSLLKQYVGTDLTLLGNIPEHESIVRSVHKYLPVVDLDPTSPPATALEHIAENIAARL
ncbi:MAG: ATP-binding protein [Nitrospirales bacterium]|nr:MAG: ATP-binding protein [Nitrospirales bacterium]